MTADELRNKDIIHYLASLGYHPKRNSSNTAMYLSPLTKETQPSFTVKKSKNRFHCYSSGARGSVIDLCMALNNVDFKGACKILEEGTSSQIPEYTPPKVQHKSGVKIHSVDVITDKELISYFTEERKINKDILLKYCLQASFSFPYSQTDDKRIYTAVAFESDLGGFELRSSWQKICTQPKSHSTIKGLSNDKIILTEGFGDFLAYMTYFKLDIPPYKTIILNGAAQYNGIKEFIGDTRVLYFGDNDKSGDEIAEQIPNLDDKRSLYPFYGDFGKFVENL